MHKGQVPMMAKRLTVVHFVAVALCGLLCLPMANVTAAETNPQKMDKPTDEGITLELTEELLEDEGVKGYRIDVETRDGIVTLSGKVNNILAKDRAERIATTVKGVHGVVNRIKILDMGRDDKAIREDVATALVADPAAEAFEIESSVKDGKVTITGTVDSWQEKQLAEKVVKGVRGVRAVDNNIKIDYRVHRNDHEVRSEIQETLKWDALVDHALIDVDVHNGAVDLTGTVGSLAEKNEAIADAWVAGVSDVDAEGLNVELWARDDRLRKDKYVTRSDAEIAEAVKDAMKIDPRVPVDKVNTEIDDGVVTLTGKVDNVKAKRSAANDARNIVGVWRVKNQIDVRPSTPTDSQIASNIRDALRRDPYVERYDVTVTVVNGEANLYGTVDSYFEAAQADDVASEVYGVVSVDNNLNVEDATDRMTYDPYVDDEWYTFDYDWYTFPETTTTIATDWEIAEEIRDEMWWSPFVDSDEVSVTVDDGVATLTGTVDTWDERAAATENAYEGGATIVDNDLAVNYGPDYYLP